MVKSPFAALNWGVHTNDSAVYLVLSTGASSTSMDGLNTWDVVKPTVYQTFGEAVNAFALNIYKGWIWRLESVAEYGDLSDEEIARLKHVRRLAWHWRGSRQNDYGRERISDQELADRGIKTEQEPYVEYAKRPPHDKYL